MLFVITNRKLVNKGKILSSVIEESVNAGVDAIILREKDLSTEELLPLAYDIKNICENTSNPTKPKLIINSNIDVAQSVNSDGLHLSFQNFTGKTDDYNGTIGVSVHSIEEAKVAEEKGADYILAGHIFVTECKKGLEPRGIDFIKLLRKHVNIKIIAIGGITPQNAKSVIEVGASGIAVMSTIMSSNNIYKITKEYNKCL